MAMPFDSSAACYLFCQMLSFAWEEDIIIQLSCFPSSLGALVTIFLTKNRSPERIENSMTVGRFHRVKRFAVLVVASTKTAKSLL